MRNPFASSDPEAIREKKSNGAASNGDSILNEEPIQEGQQHELVRTLRGRHMQMIAFGGQYQP